MLPSVNYNLSAVRERLGLKEQSTDKAAMSAQTQAEAGRLDTSTIERITHALSGFSIKSASFSYAAASEPAAFQVLEAYEADASTFSGTEHRQRLLRSMSLTPQLNLPNKKTEKRPSIIVVGPAAQKMLKEMADWEIFDIYHFTKCNNGRSLVAVTMTALEKLNLMSCFTDPSKVDVFMRAVEKGYNVNPYHSAIHAADVVQAEYAMLMMGDFYTNFSKWELVALIVGAAGHDVGHPGLTNKFLVDTKDPLAITYHNESPNEHNHAAITVKLILDHNLLPEPTSELVCSMVPDLILKTDMMCHSQLVDDFKRYVAKYGTDLSTWEDPAARTCAMQFILHIADISNVAKPRNMAIKWATSVTTEAQEQGDLERTKGMVVTPLNDRTQPNLPFNQAFFINFFKLREAFSALADVAPTFGQMALAHLDENLAHYEKLVQDGVTTV